jgi:hypothetical protein
MRIERKKWDIILLEGIALNEARKISFKLPANVNRCNGFMFSGSVAGNANKNYMLGNVSLFFNNRQSHPLHHTIHSKPLTALTRKYETLKLDECILKDSVIQGYYVDLGSAVSYPYNVRIYLDCIQTMFNGVDEPN